MILIGASGDIRVGHSQTDDRLVGLRDIMPTLLDLAGIPVPKTVEGISMVGSQRRSHYYAEIDDGPMASRMVTDGRYKLIYYATGNRAQLFDLDQDPLELHDLAALPAHAGTRKRMEQLLASELYNGDESWVKSDSCLGLPELEFNRKPDRGLTAQRGSHWPVPPSAG